MCSRNRKCSKTVITCAVLFLKQEHCVMGTSCLVHYETSANSTSEKSKVDPFPDEISFLSTRSIMAVIADAAVSVVAQP